MESIMTPLELLLDDESQLDEAGSHVAPEPKHRLMVHFEDEVKAFHDAKDGSYVIRSLLALGGIRRIYWVALGQGETAIATHIANWWADFKYEHGLGELIK